ncbi:MAG: aminotransferase class V-fold PLP-dependent enzyme [Balneola sp.]
MENRKSFLKKLSLGLVAPGVIGSFKQGDFGSSIDHTLSGEDFWEKVRTDFPLTKNRAYFNNGTFGPSPFQVLKAMEESLNKTNTSGEYGHTDEARERLAAFVGVKTSEISLTHNTTEGINITTWGLPLKRGDEVILTLHEHVGNALPWLNRAKHDGIILKTFEPADTQEENIDRVKKLISDRTRVIAIPHITCTTGLVFPVKEICALAKKSNIFTAIDGAHGAGTLDLDLKELDCDFYATCCHKWMLGPGGSGFLYVREELLDTLQVYQVGAYSDTGWDMYSDPPQIKGYAPTAHRYDYGTQSTPLYEGVTASADFHTSIGKQKIEERIRELNLHLFDGLTDMKSKLDVLTPQEPESRNCMVTFKPKRRDYREFNREVSKEGFRTRVVPESKLDAIRISTHIYNSKEEIDRFLEVLKITLSA